MLIVLEICLCKPAIYKLKILGGGKCESYKSMGGTTKTGGSKREGITIFDLNLVGETLEETMYYMCNIMSGLIQLIRSQNFPKN